MRLQRHRAGHSAQRYLQRLRPDTHGQGLAWRQLPQQGGRKAEPLRRAGQPHLTLDNRHIADIHHRRSDKLRHEQVDGFGIDLFRGADLLQPPLMHHHDAVSQRHRLDLIVRHIDRGRALLDMQPLQLHPHFLTQLGVKAANRLIHQHRLGVAHQSPADGHPLQITARQSRGPPPQQPADLQHIGHPAHRPVHLFPALTDGAQRKGHVFIDRQVGIKRKGLEHEGHVPRLWPAVLHLFAADQNVAAVDGFQPRNGAQRRGLAAARLTQKHHKLAVAHQKINVVDDMQRAEMLVDGPQRDIGHASPPFDGGAGILVVTMNPTSPTSMIVTP